MKKAFGVICVALIVALVLGFNVGVGSKNSSELVRIHIRANSNSQADQRIKYSVKDVVVDYLTPLLKNVQDKEQAKAVIERSRVELTGKINDCLYAAGFSYKSQLCLDEEFFAAREYSGVVIESGFYDALIVRLGDGLGDNWFCVVYPPLCFLADGKDRIKYESLLKRILNK